MRRNHDSAHLLTGNRFWLKRLTLVRFGLVSLTNEALYFILYWLILKLTSNTMTTLVLAGAICIVVNAYTHATITFRVRFHRRLLLGYLQIQLFCFSLSFVVGVVAKNAGAADVLIAFLTYSFWALCSYLLSRRLFQSSPPAKTITSEPMSLRE